MPYSLKQREERTPRMITVQQEAAVVDTGSGRYGTSGRARVALRGTKAHVQGAKRTAITTNDKMRSNGPCRAAINYVQGLRGREAGQTTGSRVPRVSSCVKEQL
jgi:hypothetical protein